MPRPAVMGRAARRPRGRVYVVDGSSYFSRPGPRVVDGIEILAEIVDPARVRGHVAARQLGAGRLSRPSRPDRDALPPRFDCLWCGTAGRPEAPAISRAGRSCARPAWAGPATTAFLARPAAAPRSKSAGRGAPSHGHGPPTPTRPSGPGAGMSRTTRRAPSSTTTGTCAAAASSTAPSTTCRLAGGARRRDPVARRRCRSPGEIVELAAGTGWLSPLLAEQGRAAGVRRGRGRAGPGPRAAARAPAPRAPPRRGPWAEPAPGEVPADALLAAFLLGRVPRARASTSAAGHSAGMASDPVVGSRSSISAAIRAGGPTGRNFRWSWSRSRDRSDAAPAPGRLRGHLASRHRPILPARPVAAGRDLTGGRSAPSDRASAATGCRAREGRCYTPARCHPSRAAPSRPSVRASWPRR